MQGFVVSCFSVVLFSLAEWKILTQRLHDEPARARAFMHDDENRFFSSAAIKQCFIIPRSVPFRPVWAWFWPPSSTPVLGGRPRGSFPAGRTREERAGRHKSRSCGLALALGKQIDRFVFSL